MTSVPTRRTILVGIFVTVALFILGGGILAVGSLKDTFSTKIQLTTVFSEVNGLKAGDNVWSAGLKVGVVESLEFVATAQVEVNILLDEHVAQFIHNDAEATLGSDGLIGNTIVVLSSGSVDAPILKDGDVLKSATTVATGDVLAMLQDNNKNLLAITTDIKNITAGIVAGEGSIGRLLKEDALYEQVSLALTTVNDASENAKRLTASLATFSADLNRPGNFAHDIVNDDKLYTSISASLDQLEQAAGKANEMVASLKTSVSNPDSTVGVLLSDEEMGSDLKTTMDNLSQATVLLNEDLIAIRSNFLFRPYFKKQEREAKKAAKQGN